MKLTDMVQDEWETWTFHRVAGGQARYHRNVQMALELHVKATESRSKSHFAKILYLQYAAIQENDRHSVAASSLEMGNLICALSLHLRQVMKRLGAKLDGRSGN